MEIFVSLRNEMVVLFLKMVKNVILGNDEAV